MFGLGWLVGQAARKVAKSAGMSDDDAKVVGRIASVTTSLVCLDASGLIDLSVIGPE
jgi:hypothetical protein